MHPAAALASLAALGTRHPALGTPLLGVPVSIKSSISVTGLPFETGSRFRAGVRGEADATLVARLRAAGAIVLGVTNVAEQLMAWETDNALYGRTNSPWALDRTPGGSSGGEAAAIAAGLSAGGVGSDGGGSIRVPAHFSGICGLKPTPGRVPATGHFPPCGGPFALTGVVGPMARTIDDVRLSARGDGRRRHRRSQWAPGAARQLQPSAFGLQPSGLRVGFFEDDGIVPVDADTRRGDPAGGALAARTPDVEVEPFRPDGLEEARELWWEIFGRASRLLLEPLVAGREAEVHPNLRGVSRLDAARSAAHRRAAAAGRDRARRAEDASAAADGALSGPALPRRADARLPPRRARVDDRGHARSTTSTRGAIRRGSTCCRILVCRCPVTQSPKAACPSACRSSPARGTSSTALAVARVIEQRAVPWQAPTCNRLGTPTVTVPASEYRGHPQSSLVNPQ